MGAGEGKGYSAGAIFLQVVPVFHKVQEAIGDHAKDIDRALGDSMEKSGERAGERAGKAASKSMNEELKKGTDDYAGHFETSVKRMVKSAEKEIGRLDLSTASEKMLKDLELAKKKLKELGDVDFNLDFDAKKVLADVQAVKVAVEAVTKGQHEINIDANFRKILADVAKIEALYDKATEDRTVKVDVDTALAERKMGAWERSFKKHVSAAMRDLDGSSSAAVKKVQARLEELNDSEIGIDISSKMAMAELDKIEAEIRKVSAESVDIDVKVDSASALAQLTAFRAAMARIDGQEAHVRVNATQGISGLGLFQRSSDDAANSFRSFNAILLAAASLGPALIPVLGGIAGALLAIGPAAAVAVGGLGAVIVGFTGIGDAVKALGQRDDAAARTAQTAANTQASSAKRVADARRAAAKAIEAALDRQKDAQERYADSIQDVKDAEEALRQAREEAKNTGADIQERLDDNKLAQDAGLLDVFNATVNFNAVMADGSSTNADKEAARIQLEQAKDALDDLRREQKELEKEKRKWEKEGVNGTDEVKSAQDRLNDALEAQKDAYEELRDAAEAVDEARAEGARNVAEAMKAQGDAMQNLTAQQAAVDNAFDKLGASGQPFALFLYSLRDDFYAFRDDIQAVLLPSIQSAIEGFMGSGNGSVLRQALINLAAGFGNFAKALSTSFQGPAWGAFFQMLADLGPDIQAAYGGAFIAFMEALASILTTLAPFALQFAQGFEKLMQAFAGWAASEEGANAIINFMEYAKSVGPEVLSAFGQLAVTLADLLVAMAPYGAMVLEIIVMLLKGLSALATGPLSGVIGALFTLITASQLAYLAMNFMMAGAALLTSTLGALVFLVVGVAYAVYSLWHEGSTLSRVFAVLIGATAALVVGLVVYRKVMALVALAQFAYAAATSGAAVATTGLTVAQRAAMAVGKAFALVQAGINAVMSANPIALIILAIVALIAVFVLLYRNNKGFRDFIQDAWAKIQIAFEYAWEAIKVVIAELGQAMAWLWHTVLSPALTWIAEAFVWAFGAAKVVWEKVLWPVLSRIGRVVWNLYKIYFKVAFVAILAIFKATFVTMKFLWQKVLSPVFSAIGRVVGWLWKTIVKPYLGLIKGYWSTVFSGMKWVWDNVLKPVFTYIGDKALPKLKSAFQTASDGIATIWNGLKKVVGEPIKFVINTVLRDGLIAGFNKVAGWVGQDGFDFKGVDWKFATGGVLPGYTPGRDVHEFYSPSAGRLMLSGGEAIMRPEWTRAVGTGFVDTMNAAARSGGVNGVRRALSGMLGGDAGVGRSGRANAFAKGGVFSIGDLTDAQAWARRHDYASYKMGAVGPSEFDCSGFMAALTHVLQKAPNPYSRIGSTATFPWTNYGFKKGVGQFTVGSIKDYGGTGVGHMAGTLGGLNVESRGGDGVVIGASARGYNDPGFNQVYHLGAAVGQFVDGGAKVVKGGGFGFPGWLVDIAKNPLGYVKDLINGPIDKFKDKFDGPVFDYVAKVPGKLVGGVKDALWDILPGPLKDVAKGVGKVVEGVGNGLDAVVPGDGFPGLATGGIIGRDTPGLPYNGTMMYDNGGYLPPGLTTVMNLTGKPEPVFTNDQWSKMEVGGEGGNIHYEPHFEGSNLTAEDVAADLNFTYRRIRRAGKYAGVGEQ